MVFSFKLRSSLKNSKSKLRKLFGWPFISACDVKLEELSSVRLADENTSYGYELPVVNLLSEFKYAKFVPSQFYTEEVMRAEIETDRTEVYLEGCPDHFTSLKHKRLMNNLAKLLTSGVFGKTELSEKYVRKLEHMIERNVRNKQEKDVDYLLKVMKEMRKQRNSTKKTRQWKKTTDDQCKIDTTNGNHEYWKTVESNEIPLNGSRTTEGEHAADTGNTQRSPRNLNMNNGTLREDITINIDLLHTYGTSSDSFNTNQNELLIPINNKSTPECDVQSKFHKECSISQVNEDDKLDAKKNGDSILSNTKISKSSLQMKLNFHYGRRNETLFKLKKSGRFGEVNETHIEAVATLVEDRLFGHTEEHVSLYLEYINGESFVLKQLKLEMALNCLKAYFFPSKDSVHAHWKDHLGQCIMENIIQNEMIVKDIFGRHQRDVFDYKAVMFVSKSAAALLKHRNVCVLDTLSVLLGLPRKTLLVLNMSDRSTLMQC